MYDPYDNNQFLSGQSGFGKSTVLRHILVNNLYDVNVAVWDPNWQHVKMLKQAGYKLVRPGHNLESDEVAKFVVAPEDGSPEEFDKVVNAAMARGNIVIAVEEAQEVMSASATPSVLRWLRTGRNRGCTYISVTQIPAHLKDTVLSNANYFYLVRLRRPEDTGYMAGWLGLERDQIASLKRYEYIFISQDEDTPRVFELRPAGTLRQSKGNKITEMKKHGKI